MTKCGSAGYLPTQTSENSVGYSGGINVGKIGHEGGYRLCDIAVERINAMFERSRGEKRKSPSAMHD